MSAVVALAAFAIVAVLVQGQLDAEVNDHIPDTLRALDLVLHDDVGDVEFVADQLVASETVGRALSSSDAPPLRRAAGAVHAAYPEIELAFFDANGALLLFEGGDDPPPRVSDLTGPELSPGANEVRGLSSGCGRGDSRASAHITKRRASGGGAIAACLHFDRGYLDRTSARIGAQLAAGASGSLQTSLGFPPGAASGSDVPDRATLLRVSGRAWATGGHVSTLHGTTERLPTAVAIDLTARQSALVRNLISATAFLAFGTAGALLAGWRLASIMSGALGRVGVALHKLEQQEYVHVEPVRTGDELEDLADGFNAMVDGLQERDRIRATFGKYVTPHIVDFLLERRVELGGQTLPVTILFTDIRGFTGISERMDAQALVALLNEYFTEMVTIIIDEGGVVDKYIGDAIMAVFGAPIGKPDDAVRAVRAAVRMRAGLAALNVRLVARGQLPLSTGIGLHTGEVVAGNIGSEARMEYTVIGDAVNVAARLETSTKELEADILISDVTHALVADVVDAARVGEIVVKGRAKPITVFSVTGLAS